VSADLKGRRVLLVEDEFLIAMELENVLQQCGCEVLGPASSVQQALAVLADGRPEVALLDVNLRGQRATPVAAVLRERGVPFVLMTGYSELQLSEPELRAAPKLDKPVSSQALCRALARAIDAAGASSEP
jgi:CheY-like chemotaxis protein